MSHTFYVVGPSSGERYATWVANVEFRIFGSTIRTVFALQDAKSLAKIGEIPCIMMYEIKVRYNVDIQKISL